MKELEGHTSGSISPVSHNAVKHIKGLNILRGNCCGVNILLDSSNFFPPSRTHPNMLPRWFCGDIKNKYPYRMLWCKDVKQVKGEKKAVNYDNISET